ncbi:MAG: uncharacterized protein KVP18_003442 [Porospora cf. gigantea A]|uniref:uncharacterized protein n=1 Tax=Porospora cf. gigantea A TaxID=2853593 RepID=UPI003559BDA1|nr:MAG: hypothetical protein KVP18_003442 [Porospora cf. gigantea A]
MSELFRDEFKEEDDDDEEDYTPRKKRRRGEGERERKRLKMPSFLDTEAQEDDDEDDDDEEEYGDYDDFADEADAAEDAERELSLGDRRALLQQDRRPARSGGTAHLQSAIGKIEQRYQNLDPGDEEGPEEDELQYESYPAEASFDPARLLPDASDPKLWIVKVYRQKAARDLCISICNKFAEYVRLRKPFPIYSAYAADNARNILYVEAEYAADIRSVLSGFREVNLRDIAMVPIAERPQVFTMGKKKPKMPDVGTWVRILRGVYANDLGQVWDVDEYSQQVTVKLLPRVHLESAIEKDSGHGPGKKFLPSAGRKRPPAKTLDRDEVMGLGGTVDAGRTHGTWTFAKMLFTEDGYQLKKCGLSLLLTDASQVAVTLSEIKTFNQGNVEIGEKDLRTLNASRTAVFHAGEKVNVTRGDLRGTVGIVLSVAGDIVTVKPKKNNASSMELPTLELPVATLQKVFEPGDSVKVFRGTYAGETGLVAAFEPTAGTMGVFSPSTKEVMTCAIDDVTVTGSMSSGLSSGITTTGGFSVGDMVQLSDKTVGVIIRIETATSARLLLEDGAIETVHLTKIVSKKSSAASFSTDSSGHQFGIKSSVIFIDGPHRGKSGRVVHLWKNMAFVRVQAKSDEDGLLVGPSKFIQLQAASFSTGGPGGGGGGGGRGGGGGGRGGRGGFGGRARRGALYGKTVTVTNRKHKGLLGVVQSVDGDSLRICLQINGEVISVRKHEVSVI